MTQPAVLPVNYVGVVVARIVLVWFLGLDCTFARFLFNSRRLVRISTGYFLRGISGFRT